MQSCIGEESGGHQAPASGTWLTTPGGIPALQSSHPDLVPPSHVLLQLSFVCTDPSLLLSPVPTGLASWRSDFVGSQPSYFVPQSEAWLLHLAVLGSLCTPGNQALWHGPRTPSCHPLSPAGPQTQLALTNPALLPTLASESRDLDVTSPAHGLSNTCGIQLD